MEYWSWPRIYFEHTLAIIKPDAINKVNEIQDIIEKQTFSIINRRKVRLTVEQVCELYSNHANKSYYVCLCRHMAQDDVVIYVIGRHDAISAWRTLMGPTEPAEAQQCKPDSIRALYGKSYIENAVHGSSNLESFRKEMSLLFPTQIVEPVLTHNLAVDYYNVHCVPVLLNGLTELCKQKPKFPVLWLADWLDDNNPYSPKTEPFYKIQEPFIKYPID